MVMYHSESEKIRFEQRVFLIKGTELGKRLSRYRKEINKRDAILKRGVRADVMTSNSPGRLGKGQRYRAHDEIALCHKFLDKEGVASCTFG